MSGKWIVLDGIEGSGKTTLSKHVATLLDAYYVPTTAQGDIARTVRTKFKNKGISNRSNFTYGLWMLASIFEAYDDHIRPMLNNGNNVVSDRWLSSLYTYQIHNHKDDSNFLHSILMKAYNSEDMWEIGLHHIPDLYIYCNATIDTVNERVARRGRNDNLDNLSRSDKEMLVQGYDKFYRNLNTDKIIVDCNGTEDEVFFDMKDKLIERGYLNESQSN